jgi:pimeloyl-ACP methyl ester carboxylesterase
VDLILRELHDALTGAGETGPLVLAGHSMGGLYAANFAQAYPARVKAVVMLDPTPPMWFIEMGETIGCGRPERATTQLWMSAFGVGLIRPINPLFGPALAEQRKAIGEFWPKLAAMQSRPSSLQGDWSAGSWACAHPTALVRAPGSLGDLPLLKIIQTPNANRMAEAPPGLSPRQKRNWLAMREAWDDEYITATRQGVLEYAPAGYDHGFPITQADWTYGRIRPFLATLQVAESVP